MEDLPVNSIELGTHFHDDVDDNSTLSSNSEYIKKCCNKTIKQKKFYLNLNKFLCFEKSLKYQLGQKEKKTRKINSRWL